MIGNVIEGLGRVVDVPELVGPSWRPPLLIGDLSPDAMGFVVDEHVSRLWASGSDPAARTPVLMRLAVEAGARGSDSIFVFAPKFPRGFVFLSYVSAGDPECGWNFDDMVGG